jgi:hypothetical protein
MSIVLDGATGEVFPVWTTSTRPASPATSQTGYNSTIGGIEFYNGSSWSPIAAAGVPITYTATQTFSGSSSNIAAIFSDSAEVCTISATAATGTINYDVTTQSVLYYTTSASGNWIVNFRASGSTSLDTAMSTGQSLTVAFLVTQGTTPYINSSVTVDSVAVTPKWQGGAAPASGNASSIEAYVYTIIKTGSAAFTILASRTKFA